MSGAQAMTASAQQTMKPQRTPGDHMPTVRSDALRGRPLPDLLRQGVSAHGATAVVKALPATGDNARRAVVASRKIGGAVVRNRAKRRLREAMRAAGVPADLDVVVIARSDAVTLPMPQLVEEIGTLVQRLAERLTERGHRAP